MTTTCSSSKRWREQKVETPLSWLGLNRVIQLHPKWRMTKIRILRLRVSKATQFCKGSVEVCCPPHPGPYSLHALWEGRDSITCVTRHREVELSIINILMTSQPMVADNLIQWFHVDVKQEGEYWAMWDIASEQSGVVSFISYQHRKGPTLDKGAEPVQNCIAQS